MHLSTLVAVTSAATLSAAVPFKLGSESHSTLTRRQDANPFSGRTLTANPSYAEKLESVYQLFQQRGDATNAAKVRTVQDIGTFFWISNIASLPDIDGAIAAARAAKQATGEDQIVGLVVYNLPDRDCSAGESSGELDSDNNGLARYKAEYIAPYAQKLAAATDVTFALVVEPDAVGNIVTNSKSIELCAKATPVYEEGIAHAISQLQMDHVHLYIDASHGGWLGWDDNLKPGAVPFSLRDPPTLWAR
jgi:cellulose 1,4-beta-cellobiosidase